MRNQVAVQSFGYHRYLPVGKPEILAENLDRWGADEILLQCIDRNSQNLGPDFQILERVAETGLGTPLIYAGGVRNADDGIRAIKLGADRVCLDTIHFRNPSAIFEMSDMVGAQALISALPLEFKENRCRWLNHTEGSLTDLDHFDAIAQKKAVSEALVIDWKGEGSFEGFDVRLLDAFPHSEIPIIAFGGLSSASIIRDVIQRSQVSAVAVGNFLNYREHAVNAIREQMDDLNIRTPIYAKSV